MRFFGLSARARVNNTVPLTEPVVNKRLPIGLRQFAVIVGQHTLPRSVPGKVHAIHLFDPLPQRP